MTDRAAEFLDYWQSEHVNPVPLAERQAEAERLATECLEDAKRGGINEHDLEAAANGNLIDDMLAALQWPEQRN
jgi:hypothetical protein